MVNSDVAKTLGLDGAPSRRKRKRRWVYVLVLVILAGAALWYIRTREMESAQGPRFKTALVERGSLTVIVTATGTLEPTNEVEVGSELSGTVRLVAVDFNDHVTKGQVLVRLDTSKLEAQVTQYRAAVESAKAAVLQAKATVKETASKLMQLQRVLQLTNNKGASQADLAAAVANHERAKADEVSAEANVLKAQATLDASMTDLSKAVITSPINGIVLTRDIEPGQTVAASYATPVLFTLAEDLTEMELHVDVDEADVGRVKEGQEAVFHVDAYPDRAFDARITQVRYGSDTTDGVVTYETVLKVDNLDLALRPGMTATADITVMKAENALLIPNAALRFSPPEMASREKPPSRGLVDMLMPRRPRGGPMKRPEEKKINKNSQKVWVLREGGPPRPVPVVIGASDGIHSEVLQGDLEPGMLVVTDTISEKK